MVLTSSTIFCASRVKLWCWSLNRPLVKKASGVEIWPRSGGESNLIQMSGSPTLYPIQALSSSDQPLISILSKSYRHSLHFPLRKPPLCAEISQLDTNGMIMGERLNKKTFLTKHLFPVFNKERGHLVHKLRDHDDNLVEEKHERGTCL